MLLHQPVWLWTLTMIYDTLQLLALQAWSEESHEGVLVIDSSGDVCLLNTRLKEMLGLKTEPRTVDELLVQVGPYIPDLRSMLGVNSAASEVLWGSLRFQHHHNRRLNWEQVPLLKNDRVTGLLFVFRDPVSLGSLQSTSQSFLSTISHDLRTPLSTILGFAELLYQNQGSLSPEEQQEFLGHIIKNANDLSRYTQVALDIMFLEASLKDFETEPVQLDQFVKQWMADALHRFPAERLVFHNGLSSGPIAHISPSALHKILYILVEFALAESPDEDKVEILLKGQEPQAHIVIQHRAPRLAASDVAVLFQLLQPRDLSEVGRPHLHRMQLYVANLLAERQQGYLTMRGREDNIYQIDLALPLSSL